MSKIAFCSELPAKGAYPPLPALEADGISGVSFNIFFNDVGTKCISVLKMFDRILGLED